MKIRSQISALLLALMMGLGSSTTALASSHDVPSSVPGAQENYQRYRSTTTAFVESLQLLYKRYGLFGGVEIPQAQELIRQADESAQRNDYAQASSQAFAAYNLLRDSVQRVAQSNKPARPQVQEDHEQNESLANHVTQQIESCRSLRGALGRITKEKPGSQAALQQIDQQIQLARSLANMGKIDEAHDTIDGANRKTRELIVSLRGGATLYSPVK